MTDDLGDRLRSDGFRGEIEREACLAPYTTWRIGGPAELLVSPADAEDVARALRWASDAGVGWRVLGNGSNLLVADSGVRGVVLRIRRCLDRVEHDGALRIDAGAGAFFPAVARRAAREGLAGIEFGAGIPGTIGGAIVMNAGWHEYEIGNWVERVTFADELGAVHELQGEECAFGYRSSRFHRQRGIVLGALLRLERGDAVEIEKRLDAFAESRKANQPTGLPSCGSVFIQPPGDFAGRLIDEAGLKGRRVGAIEVSPKHANFFVNLGGGTAADVLRLVERVEAAVRDAFGVELTREFEFWAD
ncbi:MAG: UDP-N-acetylmuramate dehydrogenase [bacterium]|nr:UDP-N-acetylmuramate dehydrogenase [bacterium]